MKAQELLDILNEKNKRLEEINKEIEEINADKEKLIDILIKGTSFVPDTLAYIIGYLVYAKQALSGSDPNIDIAKSYIDNSKSDIKDFRIE